MCWIVGSCIGINVCSDGVNDVFNLGLEIINWLSSNSNYRNVFYIVVGCVKCWRYVKLNLLCGCWGWECVLNFIRE